MREMSGHYGEKQEENLRISGLSCSVMHMLESLWTVKFLITSKEVDFKK